MQKTTTHGIAPYFIFRDISTFRTQKAEKKSRLYQGALFWPIKKAILPSPVFFAWKSSKREPVCAKIQSI